MKILELPSKAGKALGSHFDVRDFHDAVLRGGAVPLSVLEDQIDLWLGTKDAS